MAAYLNFPAFVITKVFPYNTAPKETILQYIFVNRKVVLITTVNSELEVKHFAKGNMKFVFVAAVPFSPFLKGKFLLKKIAI